MRKLLLVSLLALLSLLATLPVLADCDQYECRYGLDTAYCNVIFGPRNRQFRLGTDCVVVSSCSWTYLENWGWSYECAYDCRITECYEV